MHETRTRLEEAQLAIREVRTAEDPAVQRLIASVVTLADMVDRLARERAWS